MIYRCEHYYVDTLPSNAPPGLHTSALKWCGEPATRFFRLSSRTNSIIRPWCDKHAEQGFSHSSDLKRKEVSEEEYIVYDVMSA